ncbi:uncharacterized protein LOC129226739 [Uloborus diversus]|uniref:uncharacterized protein LOC129226739 n=1 Tax=Uloborus diversus TaxID=327109 RepID=UPI00240A0BB2|nr:uncharacterized protein LOC129226739 [Uloborus diversus]
MDIPFLSKATFRKHELKIHQAASEAAEESMISAAKEIKNMKGSKKARVDCGVSIDGTWQKRGYSSLNGCVTCISIDTGKILDIEALTLYCRHCSQGKTSDISHECRNHTGSSSSMETIGVYRIFERSIASRNLRYSQYYGDGDSKAFDSVKNIYKKTSVEKLECIGHIQKRVGSRLRKLKKNTKGLGGKGKLTDRFIDRLQNYYGIAIRSNVGNLAAMQQAVFAAFYHCCSGTKRSMHGQCPDGKESWCRIKKAEALGKPVKEKSVGLSQSIINTIKPTFMKLCDQELLKKCLHGKTQNANESLNGVLWNLLPKEHFVEQKTLQLGASLATLQFNDGAKGLISVFSKLKITPGAYALTALEQSDKERVNDSIRHSLPTAKGLRKKLRASRKNKLMKIEEEEGVTYQLGSF